MLSITGMTLEQFAALMEGLGYRAEKGERPKSKVVDVSATPDGDTAAEVVATETPPTEADAAEAADVAVAAGDPPEAPEGKDAVSDGAAAREPAQTDASQSDAEVTPEGEATEPKTPEVEVFYSFIWGRPAGGGRHKGAGQGNRPRGKGKPQGKGGPKGARKSGTKPQNFSARPPRAEKKIDPDNPFAAALMGLKDTK